MAKRSLGDIFIELNDENKENVNPLLEFLLEATRPPIPEQITLKELPNLSHEVLEAVIDKLSLHPLFGYYVAKYIAKFPEKEK